MSAPQEDLHQRALVRPAFIQRWRLEHHALEAIIEIFAEAALEMAEQLAFQQIRRRSATMHWHQRAFCAWRGSMDGARYQLLARSTAQATATLSMSGSTGFAKKSHAPALTACSASARSAWPVITTTGAVAKARISATPPCG